MNQALLSQVLSDFEESVCMPNCCKNGEPWEILIAMRDCLPPQERKMAQILIKLGEIQELCAELQQA